MNNLRPRNIFTEEEWKCANYTKFNIANLQSCKAETILAESSRLREEVDCQTKKSKEEVRASLEQRLKQLHFWLSELQLKAGQVDEHTGRQRQMTQRLHKAGLDLQQALCRTTHCLNIRDKREGIDKVYDGPARELLKETALIEKTLSQFDSLAEQSKEQERLLRKAKYQLCRDIELKQSAVDVDRKMLELGDKAPGLDLISDRAVLLVTDGPTVELWQQQVEQLLASASRQVTSSRQLQAAIGQQLGSCETEARAQLAATNRALANRIEQTRSAKRTLEDKLNMVQEHMVAIERNCQELHEAIAALREPLALAQLQLQGRTARPCLEMTSDPAQRRLLTELQQLQLNGDRLRQQLAAAQTQLKKLERERLVLSEDIAVKTKTLQLCEGQCLTHRQAVLVPHF